jgi:hypothetical protein
MRVHVNPAAGSSNLAALAAAAVPWMTLSWPS